MKKEYAFFVATCMLIVIIKAKDSTKMDIIFLLDSSWSVSRTEFRKMKAFIKDTVRAADIDSGSVRVGIAVFSNGVSVEFHLNRYATKSDLLQAVDLIPYVGGLTYTDDAIRTLRDEMLTIENGDRVDAPNSAIIITDGESSNSAQTIQEAEKTRASGTHIYAVGIGLNGRSEVDAMVTPPASSNSFVFDSFDELENFGPRFAEHVIPIYCTTGQYVVNNGGNLECHYCPLDTYQDIDHPNSRVVCTRCPFIGTVQQGTKSDGAKSVNECKPICRGGHQFNRKRKRCTKCPIGQFKEASDTIAVCKDCLDRRYVTPFTGAQTNDQCTLQKDNDDHADTDLELDDNTIDNEGSGSGSGDFGLDAIGDAAITPEDKGTKDDETEINIDMESGDKKDNDDHADTDLELDDNTIDNEGSGSGSGDFGLDAIGDAAITPEDKGTKDDETEINIDMESGDIIKNNLKADTSSSLEGVLLTVNKYQDSMKKQNKVVAFEKDNDDHADTDLELDDNTIDNEGSGSGSGDFGLYAIGDAAITPEDKGTKDDETEIHIDMESGDKKDNDDHADTDLELDDNTIDNEGSGSGSGDFGLDAIGDAAITPEDKGTKDDETEINIDMESGDIIKNNLKADTSSSLEGVLLTVNKYQDSMKKQNKVVAFEKDNDDHADTDLELDDNTIDNEGSGSGSGDFGLDAIGDAAITPEDKGTKDDETEINIDMESGDKKDNDDHADTDLELDDNTIDNEGSGSGSGDYVDNSSTKITDVELDDTTIENVEEGSGNVSGDFGFDDVVSKEFKQDGFVMYKEKEDGVTSEYALRLESTIATWDDAADGCGVQNYILFPGRSYRAKGVAKLLAEGETVWLNGWRSLTDDTADADGKVKTLKVDLSRPFSSDGIPYICKLGNAFVYPSTHVAVAGEASDGCSNMGQRLATIDSENDYREVLDNIPPDQAHWLHSVTTQGTFFKQCLAARKVGGQLDYIYTKCNNKHKFLCLDDPSIIETFSTVVAQKLIGFADVQEAVDAGATLFQSSTVAVSDSESVTSSSMPASSSLALSVMSTTEMVPSSTEIVPSSTEVVPSSTEVVPSSTEIVPSSSETFVQSSSVIETEEELIQTSSSDWMTSSVFSDETESTDSMELMTTTDTLESSFSSSYIPPMQASQVSTATLTLPLPTAVSQLDMTSSSVMVNDIDSETSTSVIDQTTLYVEESSYSSTEMDFSSSVIKSSSVMAEEVGSKINTALPDEISSSVEASSHMPVGMDYSSSAIKSSSAMIVDVDYETVTDFIDDTSSYVEVSSYTPTDIDYSSPTQVASVTSSPSFSVVVSSTVLVSPGGLVNAFNNTVSTSMLEDSAYDMLPSSSSSMHYQDTQSISVTYTSVIVSTPSELASNFVSAPDVPSSASVTYTSVIVSTPSELASSSVTAPDVLASASVTYTSVTVSTPSELASSSVSAPDVPSSASSAILQSYSTNMDTKITSVYTSSITDHIKYTVSSVIQASSSDVYAVDDSYVFEVTPTYVSIPTSDYEPKYDIIPTAVFEQPGIVTPSVYPEYTDGVDETFDEELETDSESGDSAENETGQSKTFPQQDEGWDVGIWVAFIALLVLVCISLIVAFILYRKRKSSKSKNISNGNTAPPGDTELREKRSLSESPQRESTTFQDKAYDI